MDERDNSWKKKKQRTASKHVMVKSRFFSEDVLGEARDDAICSMSIHSRTKKQKNLSQVHSLYTANGSLSFVHVYLYVYPFGFLLLLLPFFFYFVLIAFSVVVVVVAGPRKYQRGRKRLLRGGSTRQRRSSLAQQQQQQQQSRRPLTSKCVDIFV